MPESVGGSRINNQVDPGTPAVILASTGDSSPFAELESRSRQLAALFAARGLAPGSHVAVLLDNQLHYLEACWAAQRSGMYLTPINWHLGGCEAGYILADCEATALVTTARLGALVERLGSSAQAVQVRLVLDGAIAGFEDYEAAIANYDDGDRVGETEGAYMFYSSGTTGRPKGIQPPLGDVPFGTGGMLDALVRGMYRFRRGMTYMCPAPLYHAAPIGWSMAAQRAGGTVVVMEKFEP